MEKKVTLKSAVWTYALVTGVVLMVFSTLLSMLDMRESPLGWLGIVILGAGMTMGALHYRNKGNGGYLSYGKAYKISYLIVLIVSVIVAIYTYIYMQVIDPASLEKELIRAEERLIEDGLPEDQIEMAMEMTRKFMQPMAIAIMAVISYAIIGALMALITALIARKDNPNPTVMQENINTGPIDQVK